MMSNDTSVGQPAAAGEADQEGQVLSLQEVCKDFESGFKLGPIDVSFEGGQTVALLGRNGAGKTTLFQILTGNLDATSGRVLVQGQRLKPDHSELRKQLGYLPQAFEWPRWLSGKDLLTYATGLLSVDNPLERMAEQMRYWDCESYANRPLATLSHGMQKRVGLALATLHDPTLLVLDEPFSGLDLYHIQALGQELLRRQKHGKLTLMSTHISPYVARYCQQVWVMDNGGIQALTDYGQLGEGERIAYIEQQFFS